MTAKNPRARHRRFLSAGFFPPEVPPCFYSETFAKFRNSLSGCFASVPGKKGVPDFHMYRSRKSAFHFPRFKSADRQHSIVNPIGYFFLSKILSENYVELNRLIRKSQISSSPSIFDWSGTRALQRPNFAVRDTFISSVHARYEYLVNTDIRAFYHSTYTHVIAWSIHGKRVAKKNHSDALIGNLIDRLSRNLQDGQTVGLPVGPDTSRMIAELVGAAIDVEIQKKTKKLQRRAARFVDDFTVGCEDRISAERIIASIRRAVNEFELDLNSEKTAILDRATAPAGGWRALVRSLIPKRPNAFSAEEMDIFFFRVYELSERLPNINVMRFAIQNARRALVECSSWPAAESYLISSYKQNTTLVNLIAELFIARQQLHSDVGLQNVASFIETRLPVLCAQRRNGEAAWLLFMASALDIKLKSRSVEPFFDEEDPLAAVLIADAKKKHRIVGAVNFSSWNKHLQTDGLDSEMWLYAYEATLKNLSGSNMPDEFVKKHRYFKWLFEKRIEFYRSGSGFPSLQDILHRRRLDNRSAMRIVSDFDSDFTVDVEDVDEENVTEDWDY